MEGLPHVEDNAAVRRGMFLVLLLVVTAVFFGLIANFLMACFWAATLAILFQGIYLWLLARVKGRSNLAAFLTCLMIVLVVVIPIGLISLALVNETQVLYARLQGGDIQLKDILSNLDKKMPVVEDLLSRAGMTVADLRVRLETFISSAISTIGEGTLRYTQGAIGLVVEFFLMLYLLFYWLRDGERIVTGIRDTIPLGDEIENILFRKFAQVARATLKGTVIVAACQGAIGGILFAILHIEGAVLWGVLMGLFSLLPVGGSGIIWFPAAVILFLQGYVTDAVIIVVVGSLGIGLIDNLLRPVLVGRETRLPDYLVLLATLGGLAWLGLSGFIVGPVIAALFISCWQITAGMFGDKSAA